MMHTEEDSGKTSTKCFARPPKFKMRLLLTIIGVVVQGFGLSWLIRLGLGADPFSHFMLGCDLHLPFSFGTTQLIVSGIMFVYVILFGRQMIGYGTVANMVFLGYIMDFFGWLWDRILPEGLFDTRWIAYLVLIPAFACLVVGAATYMSAGLGASPFDSIPFILSEQLRKPFKWVRRVWDLCFMLIGWLLGGGTGIVALAVVFFTGPVVTAVKERMEGLLEKS